MTNFFSEEVPLNENQLISFESNLGLNLPSDYRIHLLKHNGGQCSPNKFSFIEGDKNSTSRIDWFLALYEGEYDNLDIYVDMYKVQKKRMPSNLLPIAHDDGGNLICIGCGGINVGKVYFWDHEKEVDYSYADDNDYSNLYLIANSFTIFLEQLF